MSVGELVSTVCRLCRLLFMQRRQYGRPFAYCPTCRGARWNTRSGRPRKRQRRIAA